MKIVSIQVGLPKDVIYRGKTVTTGIFKNSIPGPVYARATNLDGDRQADLTVHGGRDKAIYAYSVDAYDWWRTERPGDVFNYGAFGENLSIDVLPEGDVFIGDTFEVGDAVIQACQPRFPCYKLAVKFNDPSVLKTFMKSRRPGVYFRVIKEGLIGVGQSLVLIDRERVLLSVLELFEGVHLLTIERSKAEEYLKISSLPDSFRDPFKALREGS
jgi:MOSC domain-containing protein YiiM